MTQKEMIAMVRKFISDEQATGYTEGGTLEEPEGTQELLAYLDRAVQDYSWRLANSNSVRLIKRFQVIEGNDIPDDFLKFCGSVPITIEEGKIQYYGEAVTYGAIGGNPVRYFARLPLVTSYGEDQTLPYGKQDEIVITALAAIYALNKHEFNVSQDLMLLGYGGDNANVRQQTR